MRLERSLVTLAVIGALGLSGQAAAVSNEALAEQIRQISERLQRLENENSRLKDENLQLKAQTSDTQKQVEANTVAMESQESYSSEGKLTRWFDRTSIGGYGELHYNNLSQKPGKDNGKPFRNADFHRFVLFVGHEFNDRMRFFSEIEIEHSIAGEGKSGEIEIEQAYLEFDAFNNTSIKGGLFLTPVGIMNETHEPNTFYGVERNHVENIIIPATWWAAGAGITQRFDFGLSFDANVTTGLKMPNGDGGSAFRVRSGRQKVSKAQADDLAYTGRIKYTGIPGLELAGTVQYQTDMSQEKGDGLEEGWLFETHAVFTREIGPGEFSFRGLYAHWNINGSAIEAAGGDHQDGWYVEPGYRFRTASLGGDGWGDIGIYGRYEDVDGWRSSDQFNQWEVGFNYWPNRNIVIKADYRNNHNDVSSAKDYDGFDIGIGYQF